ncbi:F0F1 ATP synthase subunit delta [soil metagenome]
MAELATIARPYAEALFEAAKAADADAWGQQLSGLAAVAADPDMQRFADDPKATPEQVYQMMVSAGTPLTGDASKGLSNFLMTVIENGRLAAMPEIATQYQELLNQRTGIADATIYSAFPISEADSADLIATLERRFKRKLRATIEVTPELIGGVKVKVGDEVLDTSVQGQLERMKIALTA